MVSTKHALEKATAELEESIGLRSDCSKPRLSPEADEKNIGRRALKDFGSIEISQVIPDPEQPRVHFSEEEIEQLSASIRDKGQLHPISVRWSEAHQKWVIIAGERRFRAATRAGLPTVQCRFYEGKLTQSELLEHQLIENLLRQDLRPIEEAKAFQQLLELNGWNGKELSQAIRVSQSRIARALALLRLPPDFQSQVESGALAPSVAYELSKLATDEERRAALQRGANGRLTRDQAAVQVRKRKRVAGRSKTLKQTFATATGWKVMVTSRKSGNYEEIAEALQEALDEVHHRIRNHHRLF